MSKKYRDDGILPQTPAADYKSSKGYLVDLADGIATISSSASTPVKGVIIEGNDTAAGYASEKVSVAIIGNIQGSVPMRLSGTVVAGAAVQQASDGTVVTDAGSGSRVIVGIAAEGGGTGENIEVFPIGPIARS